MTKLPPTAAMRKMVRLLWIHAEAVWMPKTMFVRSKIQIVAATHVKCSVRLAEMRTPAAVKPSAPDNRLLR